MQATKKKKSDCHSSVHTVPAYLLFTQLLIFKVGCIKEADQVPLTLWRIIYFPFLFNFQRVSTMLFL